MCRSTSKRLDMRPISLGMRPPIVLLINESTTNSSKRSISAGIVPLILRWSGKGMGFEKHYEQTLQNVG